MPSPEKKTPELKLEPKAEPEAEPEAEPKAEEVTKPEPGEEEALTYHHHTQC